MNVHLACVTGASSGIGEAFARALAKEGVPLLITGRNVDALKVLSNELSEHVAVTYLACDLKNPASRKALIETIKTQGADLIINNAGLGYFGDALQYTTEEHLEVLKVNNEALVEITLEIARHLKETNQKGTILNVSSITALFTFPFHAVYSASKAFVNRFSLALDTELRPFGIRILTSCPGLVKSQFRIRCTKGKAAHASDSKYMSAENAAEVMLRQIQRKKRVVIFNFSSRLKYWIARLMPSSLLYRYMKRRYASLDRSLKVRE